MCRNSKRSLTLMTDEQRRASGAVARLKGCAAKSARQVAGTARFPAEINLSLRRLPQFTGISKTATQYLMSRTQQVQASRITAVRARGLNNTANIPRQQSAFILRRQFAKRCWLSVAAYGVSGRIPSRPKPSTRMAFTLSFTAVINRSDILVRNAPPRQNSYVLPR